MNLYQLFPKGHEMTAADMQARIAALEHALREIQQMSIRRQIEDLDDMMEGVKKLTPRSVFSDSVWLESLHEICERALEQTK